MNLRRSRRILAVDPTTKGFGWVVVETCPLRAVDWGLSTCGRKADDRQRAVERLVGRLRPSALVYERTDSHRTRWLHQRRSSSMSQLRVRAISRAWRRTPTLRPQHARALHVRQLLPELTAVRLQMRSAADREASTMNIYDAAWIALLACKETLHFQPNPSQSDVACD
jgi:hypothetical protein